MFIKFLLTLALKTGETKTFLRGLEFKQKSCFYIEGEDRVICGETPKGPLLYL
jgi:hypothetical protein